MGDRDQVFNSVFLDHGITYISKKPYVIYNRSVISFCMGNKWFIFICDDFIIYVFLDQQSKMKKTLRIHLQSDSLSDAYLWIAIPRRGEKNRFVEMEKPDRHVGMWVLACSS